MVPLPCCNELHMYALPACICMPLHLHDSGREILWGMIPIRQQRLSQGLAHISKSEEQQESMPSSVQGAFEAAPGHRRAPTP